MQIEEMTIGRIDSYYRFGPDQWYEDVWGDLELLVDAQTNRELEGCYEGNNRKEELTIVIFKRGSFTFYRFKASCWYEKVYNDLELIDDHVDIKEIEDIYQQAKGGEV